MVAFFSLVSIKNWCLPLRDAITNWL